MPIVSCTCGKSFNAKPELAGKRVKCPACGSPLQIPQASLTPIDDDPLGLAGFDERNLASAFNASTASPNLNSAPAYSSASPKAGQEKNNLPVILAVVGGVAALGMIAIVILVALLLPAIQAARQAARRVQAENAQRSAGEALAGNASSWIDYQSNNGGYAVKLPRHPKIQSQTRPSPDGVVFISMAVVDLGDDVGAFFVAHNDMPMESLGRADKVRVLDGSVEGLANSMNASITASRDLDAYGGMVREIEFEGATGSMPLIGTSRIVLANNRLYQLMWLGPRGERPQGDLTLFFDSFTPAGGTAARSEPEPIASNSPAEIEPPPIPNIPPPTPPTRQVTPPPVQPPSFRPSPANRSLTDLDEAERQRIYRQLKSRDRMLEVQRQQIVTIEQSGGAPESMLRQMRDNLKRAESMVVQSIARTTRISESDLQEIRREGDEKGWQ